MVPYSADVTNVLWYNMPLLAEHGVTPPTTWEELLAACDALNAAGIIADRDRATRTCGRPATGSATWRRGSWARRSTPRPSAATGKFATPEWEKAFGYIAELRRAQVRQRERQRDRRQRRRAAVLPGQGGDAPDRVVAGQLGDRRGARPRVRLRQPAGDARRDRATRAASSASRRATWSTPRAPSIPEAIEFLALLNSAENVQKFIEAEVTPLAKSASAGQDIDARSAALSELLNTAPAIGPAAGHRLRPRDGRRAVRRHRRGPRRPGDAGGGARRDRHQARPLGRRSTRPAAR